MHGKLELEKNVKEYVKFLQSGSPCDDKQFLAAVTFYREAKSSMNYSKDEIKLINSLFSALSHKKEELLKNDLKKLTVKDKNLVIKILDDINFNGWQISEDTIKKLNELVK